MRAIFISYRRDDAEGHAGRLFEDLAERFGKASVFMDVTGIEPGRDFRKVIEQQVASCGVLLAVIGKDWLAATDLEGRRRLDDPADFVRLETAAALKRDIPVIPVLVRGARMPRPEQLPEALADLAFRNSVELSHARWGSDVQLLISALLPYVDGAADGAAAAVAQPGTAEPDGQRAPAATKHTPRVIAIAAGLAIVVAGVGYLARNRGEPTTMPHAAAPSVVPQVVVTEAPPKPVADTASAASTVSELAAASSARSKTGSSEVAKAALEPAPVRVPAPVRADKAPAATKKATAPKPAIYPPAEGPAAEKTESTRVARATVESKPELPPPPEPAPAVESRPSARAYTAPSAESTPVAPTIGPSRGNAGIALWGDPASPASATRTIAIRPDTKYVNVTGGEIVRFTVGDKSFAWNFNGRPSSIDLAMVAPPGMLDHKVTAYIAPDPNRLRGR